MPKIKLLSLSLCFVFYSFLAQAQEANHLHGSETIVGGGTTQFDVVNPAGQIKLGSGTFLSLSAEKPFGNLPIYLEAQFNYMQTSGTANYNYVSASNINYVASNVNFTTAVYDANLGLKLKLFENSTIHPYIEVSGVGGFFQNSYDNSLKTAAVVAAGSDYKTVDGVMNFGVMGEAGLEIHVFHSMSLVAAFKYVDTNTQPLPTLKNQPVHYINDTFYGGLSFRL